MISSDMLEETLRDKGYRFMISPGKAHGRWCKLVEIPHFYADWSDHTDTLWSLDIVGNNFFYLIRGDKRFNLGFICEFNTTEEYVMEMAEKINTAAQKLCK